MPDRPPTEHGQEARGKSHDVPVDFSRIFYLLLRHWWIIALFVGVTMIAALGSLMTQPKIYSSRAVLQVQQQDQNVLNVQNVSEINPSSPDFINTVVETLTSNNLLLRVVEANKLAENPDFARPRDIPYTEIELANLMKRKVKVSSRRNTRLVDITVEDEDPVMAREIAASFVREFLRENFSQRMTVSRVATDFLQEEAEKLKSKLEESERKLQDYKQKNQAVSLDERQNIIVDQLKEINTKVTQAQGERVRLEADIEQVQATGPENVEEALRIGSVAAIPQVAEARSQLTEAETELAALEDRYLHKHPKHIAATKKIESLRRNLASNVGKAGDILRRQYEAALQMESKLQEALNLQEQSALDLNDLAIPFNVLQREVESDRAMYEAVVLRMKETSVSSGIEQAPYTLVEEPMVPTKPSRPVVMRSLLLAFLLSGMLACAGLITYDIMDSSLRSIDEAEDTLGLPSLAGVPDHRPSGIARIKGVVAREKEALPHRLEAARRISERRRSGEQVSTADWQGLVKTPADNGDGKPAYPIATIDDPGSALAEAYRTLRANISMLGPVDTRRVLLFVSAIPEEGKTYTSLNAATTLAQQGHSTLLVDADLRRPSLHKALDWPEDHPHGLTDIFSGNATWADAIKPTKVENLFFLPAGTRAPNPAELLSTADLGTLLRELGARYERVVFDSAPVNAVSDTLVLAPHVDQTILVIRSGKTPRRVVLRAVSLLRKAGAQLAGFVLNRLPAGRTAGYYYYYYGDKYEKDSAYGGNTKRAA
jgi:succinoglycan biosynthesis transport protein ExoP